MKPLTLYFSLLLLCFGCSSDDDEITAISFFDAIPQNKYYNDDPLPDSSCYGEWSFDRSSGGFTGEGFPIDFDILLLKANGIFGLVRNDSLLVSGKVTVVADPDPRTLLKFEIDGNPSDFQIDILNDNEKYLDISEQQLNLIAPCCDRYNLHFTRIN